MAGDPGLRGNRARDITRFFPVPALGPSPDHECMVESDMAEVMIAVMPFHGHVAPMAAVAAAFVEAGHGVPLREATSTSPRSPLGWGGPVPA